MGYWRKLVKIVEVLGLIITFKIAYFKEDVVKKQIELLFIIGIIPQNNLPKFICCVTDILIIEKVNSPDI